MTYIVNKPADTQTIAQGPADIRAEIAQVANAQVTDAGTLKGLTPGNAAGQIPVSNDVVNAGLNAEKVGGNLPSAFASASHVHGAATSSSNGFMSNTDKIKLDTIAAGAEVNQNAFSNVLVNGTSLQADSKSDTLELAAGTNITLTPDATNDRVTIGVSGTVPSAKTATTATSATTAAALSTARTIALSGKATGTATAFNGSANIAIPVTTVTADSCTGNATTATKLATARTINGVSFDGSANITVTAAANGGTADYAARLLPLSGPSSYKLAYAADGARTNPGEWGRVVMRYDSNGQTYGVRCDRADQADSAGNANTVGGYSAAQLIPSSATVTTTASTQANISRTIPIMGSEKSAYLHTTTGLGAGTYTLQSVIQNLINRSHTHSVSVSNCNCDCGDDSSSSCFISGSMILMEDYSFKPIEKVTAGDKIIGKDATINTVQFRYEALLGNKRSIFTFTDQSLFWSGEHPLWIKTLAGEEYLGVYDYNQYVREKNEELTNPDTGEKIIHQGLTRKDPIVIASPVFFYTLNGWKLDDAFIDRSFAEDTKIYSLYTDGSHTMFVNGYLVGAFATDIDYDYL